jgi:hypothetical protein
VVCRKEASRDSGENSIECSAALRLRLVFPRNPMAYAMGYRSFADSAAEGHVSQICIALGRANSAPLRGED